MFCKERKGDLMDEKNNRNKLRKICNTEKQKNKEENVVLQEICSGKRIKKQDIFFAAIFNATCFLFPPFLSLLSSVFIY